MNYWLVKSEPFKYSWNDLVKDKETTWDGIRNYAARNNLAAMKKGDPVLFYHSNEGLEVVGIAQVSRESFPDPTSDEDRWVAVKLKARKKLKNPVSLKTIKEDKALKDIQLVRLSRLSVVSLTPAEYQHILELSNKV